MNAPSFFNKVSQVSTKELIDFINHNQSEITIKILKKYIKTKVLSKKNDKHLYIDKFGFYDFSNESATCLFQVKDDKYFFKSHISSTNSDCTLEIPSDIFQLQRRNDYRATMPMGLAYTCEILSINGYKAKIKAEIRDMSLGGCQISIEGITSDIKQNDELDLYLKLNKFEFQKIPLTAKHIKFIDTQNTALIGASLNEPDSDLLSELQSMLMYLDRVHRGKAE